MTGDSTKLQISDDTKYRYEGRQSLPRRKATKISYSESGGFENDLAIAMQESLKYVRQTEIEHKVIDESKKRAHVCLPDGPNEPPVVNNVNKVCLDNNQGGKQLKELLLLHIDLAEHQQEMIIQKNKDIKELTKENDALKCRLERMERRMALLKQKEDIEPVSCSSPMSGQTKVEDVDNKVDVCHTNKTLSNTTCERGTKRKAGIEQQNVNKKFAVEGRKSTGSTHHLKSRRHFMKNRRKTLPAVTNSKSRESDSLTVTNQRHRKSATVTSSETDASVNIKEEKKFIPIVKDAGSEDVLRTKEMYYVSCVETLGDGIISNANEILRSGETQLEVPTWKPKKYQSLWVLEGTENTEDEVYIKRHQKLEIEEKRRKRWDIQMVREQTIYDKLRENYSGRRKKGTGRPVDSFYPRLDDITHIEVTDRIPVMAFGHALPGLQSSDFELSWEVEPTKNVHSSSSRSSHRHSRHK